MTASDDDNKPVMRLWDLRKSTTHPMLELGGNNAQNGDIPGHSRGIVALDWCPYDEAIIVSSGKDKRTLFWDLYSCQVVEELKTTSDSNGGNGGNGGHGGSGGNGGGAGGFQQDSNASPFGSQQASGGFGSQSGGFGSQSSSGFGGGAQGGGFGAQATNPLQSGGNAVDSGVRDIVWSPSMPGVLACSTLGREMQIHGITAFSGNPQRAPKWLKRPGSVSFGFGGKLVSCSQEGQNKVTLSTVTSEPALVQSASSFNDAMASNDFHNYCGYKVLFFFSLLWGCWLMVVPLLPLLSFFFFLLPSIFPSSSSSLPSRVFCRYPYQFTNYRDVHQKCVDACGRMTVVFRKTIVVGVIPISSLSFVGDVCLRFRDQ